MSSISMKTPLPNFPRVYRRLVLFVIQMNVGLIGIDWSRGVDGERYIEILKPIPTSSEGMKFELRRETLGAYDKGKAGLVLEEQILLVDGKSGEVYTKFIGSSFFVGQVPHSPDLMNRLIVGRIWWSEGTEEGASQTTPRERTGQSCKVQNVTWSGFTLPLERGLQSPPRRPHHWPQDGLQR